MKFHPASFASYPPNNEEYALLGGGERRHIQGDDEEGVSPVGGFFRNRELAGHWILPGSVAEGGGSKLALNDPRKTDLGGAEKSESPSTAGSGREETSRRKTKRSGGSFLHQVPGVFTSSQIGELRWGGEGERKEKRERFSRDQEGPRW